MNRENRHLPILDYFRGIAILSVVGAHLLSGFSTTVSGLAKSAHQILFQAFFFGLKELLELGAYGVAIFFVVSGFCIHLSYRRSSDAGWLIFYIRRVFRLYPAYLCSLLFFIFVLSSTRWPGNWPTSTGRQLDLLLHLLLAHNLLPQTSTSIDGPYWSLAIEFQLYLLFPLLLFLAHRFGWRRMLILTAIVEVISRIYLTIAGHFMTNLYPSDWVGWINLSPFGFWFSWALGAALAEAFVEKKPLPFSKGPLHLWIWPLAIFTLNSVPYLKSFTFPLAALGTAHFLAHFLTRDPGNHEFVPNIFMKFLSFTGAISYSLYLLHGPLFMYLMVYRPTAHGKISVYATECTVIIGAFLAIVATSYLLFRLIETPGINLGKTAIHFIRSRNRQIKPA